MEIWRDGVRGEREILIKRKAGQGETGEAELWQQDVFFCFIPVEQEDKSADREGGSQNGLCLSFFTPTVCRDSGA